MAENRRDQNATFYRFSRGQLVILVFGFTLASAVVFSLGVLIGQRIEERKLVQKEAPLVKIPIQPLSKSVAERQVASAKEEITFYDTLGRAPAGGSVPSAEQAEQTKPVQEKPAQSSETTAAAHGASDVSAPERPWTVQVNAFRDERDAQSLSQRLKKKGYDAYVVSATIRDRIWHRVRVGHFPTREEASVLQEELKSKEKFTKAITVSR